MSGCLSYPRQRPLCRTSRISTGYVCILLPSVPSTRRRPVQRRACPGTCWPCKDFPVRQNVSPGCVSSRKTSSVRADRTCAAPLLKITHGNHSRPCAGTLIWHETFAIEQMNVDCGKGVAGTMETGQRGIFRRENASRLNEPQIQVACPACGYLTNPTNPQTSLNSHTR